MTSCPLCHPDGESVLWQDAWCRVIAVVQPGNPGYCRVIWQAHVREMTDLAPAQRDHLMQVVWAVEAALRATLRPVKINIASLGNQVPHLHWHVIPRFVDDAHFPDAVWAAPRRAAAAREVDHAALAQSLRQALAGIPSVS